MQASFLKSPISLLVYLLQTIPINLVAAYHRYTEDKLCHNGYFFDVLVSTVASQQEDFGTWCVAPAMDRACFHSVLCLHELSLHTPAYSSIRRHRR